MSTFKNVIEKHTLPLSLEEQPPAKKIKTETENKTEEVFAAALFDTPLMNDALTEYASYCNGFKKLEDRVSAEISTAIAQGQAEQYLARIKELPFPLQFKENIINKMERAITDDYYARHPHVYVINIPELLMKILRYLPFAELCKIAEVSRYFYECSRKTLAMHLYDYMGRFERNVALDDPKPMEKKYVFLSSLLRFPIKKFRFFGMDLNDDGLRQMLEKLEHPAALKKIQIGPYSEDDASSQKPALKSFSAGLKRCTEIKSISINRCEVFPLEDYIILAHVCTKLENITLYGLGIAHGVLPYLGDQCKAVTTFSYTQREYDDNNPIHEITFLTPDAVSPWSQLKSLKLACPLSQAQIVSIGAKLQSLTYLDLYPYNPIPPEDWLSFGQQCSTNLETLNLSIADITDDAMTALAQRCKRLHTIDCSGSDTLTAKAAHSLATHCLELHTARFDQCLNIGDGAARTLLTLKKLEVLSLFRSGLTFNGLDFIADDLMKLRSFTIQGISDLTGAPEDAYDLLEENHPEFVAKFHLSRL